MPRDLPTIIIGTQPNGPLHRATPVEYEDGTVICWTDCGKPLRPRAFASGWIVTCKPCRRRSGF